MYLILKRAVVFTAFFLIGCSSEQARINKSFEIAAQNNYTPQIIQTKQFPIQVFHQNHRTKHAVIYLEGDGLVLNSFGKVAISPTPTDPIALRLAGVDNRPLTKIVINRPFHYANSLGADSKYWTTARYGAEVIESILQTIKILQNQFGFETIEIVAYSGGACVALLLAPQLNNIKRIVSFAGNLDHKSWTTYHEFQPLFESLDPMENKELLRIIPQIHYVGLSDDNTTPELAKAYKQSIDSNVISIVEVNGFDHDSNWPDVWEKLPVINQ